MHQHTSACYTPSESMRGRCRGSMVLKKSYDRINFNCGTPINVVLMRHHKMLLLLLLFAHRKTMQMDLCEPFNLHFPTSHCSASMALGDDNENDDDRAMNDALQNCTPVT